MFHSLKKIRRNAVLTAALTSLFALAAHAAPLAEAEALRLGLSRPELTDLAQARLGESAADLLESGTWPNPTLEIVQEKTGATREQGWQLSQPFDVSGRRGLRSDAAAYRHTAVEAENHARISEHASNLRRNFYDVLRRQETLRAVDAWARRFAEIGKVVDKLARAGEASGYDRRRLAREQSAAEARLAEAQADLERSRARLSAWLGVPANEGVAGRLLPDAPGELATLQPRLLERPDLAALSARAAAANADNAAARRNFPELTLGVGSKRVDNGITQENGTLFSVSLPLPIFDRQQAGERRSAAQAMAAQAEFGLARQKAAGEFLGLHRQLSQLIAAAERYRRNAVEPSSELVRIAEAAYRAGESPILELLDAYKGALDAESTALDLEWKAREARIEFDQLTGNHPQ